ncbi:MAG: TolC family protein, partial [Verrucomicrobiota bacterium]
MNRECAKARRLLEVAFVLFLTGCGAGVAPERDYAGVGSDAPVNWVATKEGRAGVDGDWVRRFGESRLTALVDEAVMANPNMRVAEERVKRAALVAQRSQGGALPQASAGLNGNRNKQVFVGLPIPGATGPTSSLSTSLGASLNVSWEPDIWGKVAAENSAELARLGGEEQAYRAARSSLAAQVAKAWFALGEANEQLRLAYESLVIRQKTERAIEERFEQSLESEGGTAAQYRLAKTDTASAKGEIERWKGEVELAKRQLELLVGRYPEGKAGRGGG